MLGRKRLHTLPGKTLSDVIHNTLLAADQSETLNPDLSLPKLESKFNSVKTSFNTLNQDLVTTTDPIITVFATKTSFSELNLDLTIKTSFNCLNLHYLPIIWV